MTTTSITKHFNKLPKLMTFKAQWDGEVAEQDFARIMLKCNEEKIEIYKSKNDEDLESLGFYSSPKFSCSKEKVNKLDYYFLTYNYPFFIEFYNTPDEIVFIDGFDNFWDSDEIIPLETIIDDVLAILMSEDESKNE